MFEHVLGQPAAVGTLKSALAGGRVHHAYRFEGPPGVGKELCALAFAQALIEPEAKVPLALASEPPHLPLHPDLILIGRGLYRDQLDATEATGISVEQIRRVVLQRVGFPPHQGRALVFIVRDAEELTVSAANALLKTLEEPRAQVHFILLTSAPERLLDTVRSRTLPVRFAPLPEPVIGELLRRAGKPQRLAALAHGSARLAFLLADDEQMQAREAFQHSALEAVQAPHFAAALEVASNLPKEKAVLREHLQGLCHEFASVAREQLDADSPRALTAARQFDIVQTAILALERNAQPALVVEAMLSRLRHA